MKRRRRDWGDLPEELTAAILTRVGYVEILKSARFVCRSWFHICNGLQIWGSFDLTSLSVADEADRHARLLSENLCRSIVDCSAGRLQEISLHGFGTDRLLRHIAHRSSQIKCLRLHRCRGISSKAFCEAVAKLPMLEELEIYKVFSLEAEALEAVGRFCPQLSTLKYNCQGQEFMRDGNPGDYGLNTHAFAIAENFPRLRCLEIRQNQLSDAGLLALLDACPHLDSLDLLFSGHIKFGGNLRERCNQQIKHLRIPYDPLLDYNGVKVDFQFVGLWMT